MLVSRRLNKRGFTLLEIVVVIAIISILAYILVPMYGRARSEARRMTCANNLVQLQRAMSVYADDHSCGERDPALHGHSLPQAIAHRKRRWITDSGAELRHP